MTAKPKAAPRRRPTLTVTLAPATFAAIESHIAAHPALRTKSAAIDDLVAIAVRTADLKPSVT